MNCLQCAQWSLRDSPLRKDGFGLCKARTGLEAKATMSAPGCACKVPGRFVQAIPAVIARRQRELT